MKILITGIAGFVDGIKGLIRHSRPAFLRGKLQRESKRIEQKTGFLLSQE
ncbi:MAG: hypothetical protein MUO85_09905 [candidate division Zixibacteria bacterium]|nr:hypothetical protein [candidate division Zixibacteria bacterium]